MLVVNRFRVSTGSTSLAEGSTSLAEGSTSLAEGSTTFQSELEAVLALLAAKPGYVDGVIGRNLDEPDLWLLSTRWEGVGAYRRALSSYELKMYGVPVLSRAIDEPGAYELVEPSGVLNEAGTRVT